MTQREALERWGTKIGNCEVTSQDIGPFAKSVMKWNGPEALNTLGRKYQPTEKTNVIADCLENQFASCYLCGTDNERRLDAKFHTLLQVVDKNPHERARPCDVKK